MKLTLKIFQLLLLNLLTVTSLFSQTDFKKGYFIDNAGQRVDGYIRDAIWYRNPMKFDYKPDSLGKSEMKTMHEVKEFALSSGNKYIRAFVDIDTSLLELGELDYERQPRWKSDTVFLKVLIEGMASLYHYNYIGTSKYFYSLEDSPPKQLIYKKYFKGKLEEGENKMVLQNKTFQYQLKFDKDCSDYRKLMYLDYELEPLTNYFNKYNKCKGIEPVSYLKKNKLKLKLKAVSGVNLSYLNVQAERDYHIGLTPTALFGMELEAELPSDRKRWSLFLEPVAGYLHSKTDQTSHGSTSTLTLDLNYLEVKTGVRYSKYLSNDFRLFVNPYFVGTMPIRSGITEEFVSTFSNHDMSPVYTFGLGAGCSYKNFGAELKYYLRRNLTSKYIYLFTDYYTISLSLSYRFFETTSN